MKPPDPAAPDCRPLLLLRVYSGLDPAAWHPSGTPAIGRLVERLAERGHGGAALFCARTPDDGSIRLTAIQDEQFGRLAVYRLGYVSVPGPRVLGGVLNRMRALWIGLRLYRRHRCRMIYVDRVHLVEGAVFACFGYRVVWRCLGAMPFVVQRNAARLRHRLLFWMARSALAAPFAALICTRDGAPWWQVFPERWRGRRLAVPLNGVDRAPVRKRDSGLTLELPHILFVNRMVPNKNPMILAKALKALAARGVKFRATLVGYGPELDRVRDAINAAGLGEIVDLPGRVAYADLALIRAKADIAVLLNRGGQLSNVMLESLAAGLCPVGFGPDPETDFDLDTRVVLPSGLMCEVDRSDPVASLTDTLAWLLAAPNEISARKLAARAFADERLEGFTQRLDREIELMAAVEIGPPDLHAFENLSRSSSP